MSQKDSNTPPTAEGDGTILSNSNSNSNSNINSNVNSNDGNNSNSNNNKIPDPLQTIAVVALAGFAGSLCGISIVKRRIHPPPPSNLPIILAFSTATFAGIVEFSSLLSPTKMVRGIPPER